MAAEQPSRSLLRTKDGRSWRLGCDHDVAWIRDGTYDASDWGRITAAIPPLFEAYATVELPRNWEEQQGQHDRAMAEVLAEQSGRGPWWLGYLDTGADDVVFPDAPMVTLYGNWRYVLVQAGPEQATSWRHYDDSTFWKGALPNLIFPADRSWLVSTLWDDTWTCVGGPEALVTTLLDHRDLRACARRVALDEDVTPPSHQAL